MTEVTTILTALTILSGVAAPAVTTYVEDAKLVRARGDVRTIAISLVRLMSDVGPERAREDGWATYDLLVGAGLAPATDTRCVAQLGDGGGVERRNARRPLDHQRAGLSHHDSRVRSSDGAVPIFRIRSPPTRGGSDTR